MFTESAFAVVVGAGPTGLTVARELRRRDVPFRVLERSEHPFTGSRGKGIQPRTLEVLHDLGLLEAFMAAGGDYPPLLVHLPDGGTMTRRMAEPRTPTESVPWPNPLMVPQWRTGELLADGIDVEYGVGLTSLTQDEDGVRLVLSTGEQVCARYVVGADGGHSTVRRVLGVAFEGATEDAARMLIADVQVAGLDRENWHVWPDSDGRSMRLGLCPLAGTDDFQLYASDLESTPEQIVAAADPSLKVTAVGWTSRWRPNIRMAERFRVGRVLLAGDAAHVHPPTGGQGLNTGVQDAYNLGWKLATGNDELIDTYEAERLPVAAAVLGISTKLYRRAVERREDAMRRDDPELQQLELNYRDGPLARDHRARVGGLVAGDRAPDAQLTGGRVFDLLRGPHPTLLAVDWPGPLPDLGVPAHRIDEAREIYDGPEPALYLVRPDNYVGCVSDRPQDIVAYLDLIGGAQTALP